ncbi:cbb3-type cytochrome c oxidase subunit I [Granulicella cerasi]|uniref:Cbb3-type cytochrome c oxidase subunit I n=1 Tax=Granulicella cerasi TaxID=741063 RepID=A0ABW1Z5Q6_9BACT|nr:cbb3-type cytochrome c oxidase subunit I [Granulicella cerasi]
MASRARGEAMKSWLHHRTIGFGYLLLSLIAGIVGVSLSLAMRIHLAWPTFIFPLHGEVKPEEYLALVTMHGTIMLFFVMTVAPVAAFSNLFLPAQIGAIRMSFPRLNLTALLVTTLAFIVLCAAFFVEGGAPIGGWMAYPPLSTTPLAGPGQGLGMDLWLLAIALFGIGTTMGSVNLITTTVQRRCEGMTWQRMPLTVWAWFTASLLVTISFTVLLAAIVLLCCDRHLHTAFFIPASDYINGTPVLSQGAHRGTGSPLLWLHLFWFFGHPEVYIAILPGMGMTSMVLANFAHRRIFAYRMMIVTTLLIGLLGIIVWGHHMFVAGLNPFAGTIFSISSLAIAIPSTAKVFSWLATAWRSRMRLATPALFALGFVSFFIAGGLTGPVLAQPILDEYLHNTMFVVAHFHLILGMAATFGLFCAIYYWFPLMFGTMLHERLGKWHFWLSILLAYSTFLPMHLTGLTGEPRHYAQLNGMPGPAATLLASTMPMQGHISASALMLATVQLLFVINVIWSLAKRKPAPANPWNATTLEWNAEAHGLTRVFREPCDYSDDGESFTPQWSESPTTRIQAE